LNIARKTVNKLNIKPCRFTKGNIKKSDFVEYKVLWNTKKLPLRTIPKKLQFSRKTLPF